MRTTQPPLGVGINWNHPLAKGLTGCWLLNEGGGLKAFDSSEYIITPGALTGTGIVYTASQRGQAVKFTRASSNNISLGNPSALNLTAAYTVSLWLRPTSFANFQNAIFKGDNTAGQYGIFIPSTGIWTAQKSNGAPDITGAQLTLGVWANVVATYDGSVTRTYHNGVFKNVSASFSSTSRGSTVTIGADTVNTRYFDGLINDVKIYNRCLSATEVMQLYTQPYCMFK